ncbi:MAG: hypothetical protein AAGI51_10240 [Pseudomonadota bacterium]
METLPGGLFGPAVVAALVAAAITWGREAYLDRTRRRERVRDVQIALAAEIRAYVAVLERDDPAVYGAAMGARIREAGDGEGRFTPFILRERNDTVFNALLPEIQMVPEGAVDDVVVYYQQTVAIAALAEDMRTEAYGALEAERRAAIYADYTSMKVEALRLGKAALASLGRSVGRDEAEPPISSPVEDRSGR